MKLNGIVAALICELLFCAGCVSKTYVRNQLTPIIDKVNRLDDETTRNTNEIRDTSTRAAQTLDTLNTTTAEAATVARDSEQRSAAAQQSADTAFQRSTDVSRMIANLDNYKMVRDVSVHFSSGGTKLDDEATRALDELGAQCSNAKNYVLAVEGGTDSTGTQDSNYSLSERRAEVVVNYLATKYDIPVFKMHRVGLGEDKPIDSNDTPTGRAHNRRADVQLFSVQTNVVAVPSAGAGPSSDEATSDEEDEGSK